MAAAGGDLGGDRRRGAGDRRRQRGAGAADRAGGRHLARPGRRRPGRRAALAPAGAAAPLRHPALRPARPGAPGGVDQFEGADPRAAQRRDAGGRGGHRRAAVAGADLLLRQGRRPLRRVVRPAGRRPGGPGPGGGAARLRHARGLPARRGHRGADRRGVHRHRPGDRRRAAGGAAGLPGVPRRLLPDRRGVLQRPGRRAGRAGQQRPGGRADHRRHHRRGAAARGPRAGAAGAGAGGQAAPGGDPAGAGRWRRGRRDRRRGAGGAGGGGDRLGGRLPAWHAGGRARRPRRLRAAQRRRAAGDGGAGGRRRRRCRPGPARPAGSAPARG